MADIRSFAKARGDDIPVGAQRTDIAQAIERRRMSIGVPEDGFVELSNTFGQMQMIGAAQNAYVAADYATTWTLWNGAGRPQTPLETLTYAETLANRGDEQAVPAIEALRRVAPVEALVLLGRLRWRQGKPAEAADALSAACVAYRTNPWPLPIVMHRVLTLMTEIARDPNGRQILPQLMDALSQPFAVGMFDTLRRSTLLFLAQGRSGGVVCDAAEMALVASWEPEFPWQREFLTERVRCYEQNRDPRTAKAKRDLEAFLEHERQPLETHE